MRSVGLVGFGDAAEHLRLTFVPVAFCFDPLSSPITFAGSDFDTPPLRTISEVLGVESMDKALPSRPTYLASVVQINRPYQKQPCRPEPFLVFEYTMSFG